MMKANEMWVHLLYGNRWRIDVRNTRTKFASAVVGLAALTIATASAHAALITYNFTGTVNTLVTGTPFEGTFSFGQSVSGSFVLDNSAADIDGDPDLGTFAGAVTSISVTIGSYSASATGGDASTSNDFPEDSVFIGAAINDGPFAGSASVTGPSVGGLDLGLIGLQLQDSTLTALTSDALPSPISLTDFDSVFGLLDFFDPLDPEADSTPLAFSLDSLETVIQLSENGPLSILSLGILSVVFLRRRKIQKQEIYTD
jgi:hypothetical protein